MPRYIFIPDRDQFEVNLAASTSREVDEPDHVKWLLSSPGGVSVSGGESLLSMVPMSDSTVAVIPVSRIAFIDAILPPVSAQKREQLLNFAIEDKLTIDPATVHAVVIGQSHVGANHYVVAAIDRHWLAAALQWLARHGLSAQLAVPETALHWVGGGEWLVHLHPRSGYAVRADGLAYGIDQQSADLSVPPFALTLALNEAAAAADSRALPTRINIVAPAEMVAQIDRLRWQSALGGQSAAGIELGVKVEDVLQTSIVLFNQLARSNLLVGPFKPVSGASSWRAMFRPAMLVAAAILALHFVFIGFDAWRLSQQRSALDAQMRSVFRQSFPEATAIVDPVLQMSRNLAQLKRERGVAADPLIEQLALAASLTTDVSAEIRSLKFDDGKLMVTLTPNAAPALQSATHKSALASVTTSADATNLRLDGPTP